MPRAPVRSSAAISSRRPGVDHQLDRHAVLGDRGQVAQRREVGAALLRNHQLGVERILHRLRRADVQRARRRIEQQQIAFADRGADVADAADHRHAHRARDDDDVRGERAFLEHDALQAAAVIFEQFGGAEVACDQDRILPQAHLRRGSHLARHDADQPVRQILQIVHPVAQQRIVDLAHPHPGALLDALDRGFGGQAAVDRFVDPPRPAFVIGEHLVGLEDFVMFAADRRIRPGSPCGRSVRASCRTRHRRGAARPRYPRRRYVRW